MVLRCRLEVGVVVVEDGPSDVRFEAGDGAVVEVVTWVLHRDASAGISLHPRNQQLVDHACSKMIVCNSLVGGGTEMPAIKVSVRMAPVRIKGVTRAERAG